MYLSECHSCALRTSVPFGLQASDSKTQPLRRRWRVLRDTPDMLSIERREGFEGPARSFKAAVIVDSTGVSIAVKLILLLRVESR